MIIGDQFDGRRTISVKKMKELLSTLPDTDHLCAQSTGNTGNIGIFHNPEDNLVYAAIDIKGEFIDNYESIFDPDEWKKQEKKPKV
jgi:hypothetical protein